MIDQYLTMFHTIFMQLCVVSLAVMLTIVFMGLVITGIGYILNKVFKWRK